MTTRRNNCKFFVAILIMQFYSGYIILTYNVIYQYTLKKSSTRISKKRKNKLRARHLTKKIEICYAKSFRLLRILGSTTNEKYYFSPRCELSNLRPFLKYWIKVQCRFWHFDQHFRNQKTEKTTFSHSFFSKNVK